MSNWDGVGIPENGQEILVKGYAATFIGLNRDKKWVVEKSPFAALCEFNISDCKPIKTPEQIEIDSLAGTIKSIMKLQTNHLEDTMAYELFHKGYHNQPKVKPISLTEFKTTVSSGDGYSNAFTDLVSCGHIIEAKDQHNESLTEDKQ